MSTDSVMVKYIGSSIPTLSLMGKELGSGMYVLFAFAYHIPVQPCLLLNTHTQQR